MSTFKICGGKIDKQVTNSYSKPKQLFFEFAFFPFFFVLISDFQAEKGMDAKNWKVEAEAVVKDIEKHLIKIEVVEGSDQCIFFNLTTLENQDYIVELSVNGFRVVRPPDKPALGEMNEYYETPYSLLGKISTKFEESFGHELIKQLNCLANSK